jgi:hypothetical protein
MQKAASNQIPRMAPIGASKEPLQITLLVLTSRANRRRVGIHHRHSLNVVVYRMRD